MRFRVGYVYNWQKPLTAVVGSLLLFVLIILEAVFFPIIIWMSFAYLLAYAIEYLAGNLLRAKECAEVLAKKEAETGSDECAVKGNAYRRISPFASLLITSVLSFILQHIIRHCKRLISWPNTVFKCLCLIHHCFKTFYALAPIFCKRQV